jgi:large subunit ribosomal protein L13
MALDMNKAFFLKKENRKPRWKVIDARGKVLGRLATQVADMLRGKHVPSYTPHTDGGDYVVIINAQDVVLTGNKLETKKYATYSGWIGGYKEKTAVEIQAKNPALIIELAVKRMLPKTKMGRTVIKKLKVYAGAEHPHQAQIATAAKAA